jgi:3-methyladenine DNA glycosylase AlkC
MAYFEGVEKRVSKVQHGFREMREEALNMVSHASSPQQSLQAARRLYASKTYQVRMVGVFALGYIASGSEEAIKMLRHKVSEDKSWQVQEILAQAFNEYCKGTGYEKSIPVIRDWLSDKNPNTRRAVTEGLRIWNRREYFKAHPEVAVGLLSGLKDDESEYVRKSVGNAIRDISRNEKDLVRSELATWDLSNSKVASTHALASRFIEG